MKIGDLGMAFEVPMRFEPPPCDRCERQSVLQIVTIAFDGPSPVDQFFCRIHAPVEDASEETGAGAPS
jgi:hypothetical protein